MMQNLFAKHLGLARASGARDHQGRRRLVRHQGAHLCRRDGDRRAVASCSSRPVKFVADRLESFVTDIHARDHRVNAQIGVKQRRHHHGLRDRRPHRHRPLFGLSAHQRHRSQPGRQPRRRPLHLPELPRARARRVPEQERDVPVPRGRPSDRDRGHRRPGRSRRREDRHGPARDPPAQPHPRRRLSVHRRRRASSSRRCRTTPALAQSRRHDGLRGRCAPSRRGCASKASIAASASRPSSR